MITIYTYKWRNFNPFPNIWRTVYEHQNVGKEAEPAPYMAKAVCQHPGSEITLIQAI